jgi:hypothetical protein
MCQPVICNPRAARRLENRTTFPEAIEGWCGPINRQIYIESARLDPRLVVIPFCSSEQVHMSITISRDFLITAQWFEPTLSLQLVHQSCPVLAVLVPSNTRP